MKLEYLEQILGPSDPDYKEPTFECPFCKIRLSARMLEAGGVGHIHINLDKNAAICLSGTQSIITDSGNLPIYRVGALLKKKKVKVLSLNSKGELEWKSVLRFYSNGRQGSDGFLKIKTTIDSRNGATVTPNHDLFDKNINRVRADSLCVGDEIYAKDYEPSYEQWQILYGTLLGDGHVTRNRTICIEHEAAQLYYLNWKINSFPNYTVRERIINDKWGRRITYQGRVGGMRSVARVLRKQFYKNGQKIVTNDVLHRLDVLGVAVWFMDDGCFHTSARSRRFILSYQCFDSESRKLIKTYFERVWGWFGVENEDLALVFDANSTRKIKLSLGEYLREMRTQKRETKTFIPFVFDGGSVKAKLVSIESIEKVDIDVNKDTPKNRRYCLEVEDNHNFFTATGILVGNCHQCNYRSRNIRNLLYQVTGKMPRRALDLKDGALAAVKKILTKIDVDEGTNKTAKCRLPKEYVPLTFPATGIVGMRCAEYLKGRGVSRRLAEDCQVGYAVTGRFAGMLIFPVYIGNSLRFYTSRAVMPFAPKTLHASSPRGGIVFNYNNAVHARRVFVSEGPFDALSWPRKYGVGVATMGHSLGQDQARLLANLPAEEFVMCYDSDCPESTLESAYLLRKFVDAEVTFIVLKHGDPNSERKRLIRYIKGREKAGLGPLISRKFCA